MIATMEDFRIYVEETLQESLPNCENLNYLLDVASDYFKSIYTDCCTCSCSSVCSCDSDITYPNWAIECICKGVYYWATVESGDVNTTSEAKMQEVIYRCTRVNCGIRVDC